MTPKLHIQRIEDGLEWLESQADDYTSSQSLSWLIDQMGMLCKSLAFAGAQMAISKKELNQQKSKAYESLAASSVANAEYFAPSLAKDYISSKLVNAQYNYDIAKRFSRVLVHTIDALRTCISALKTENQYSSYGNNGIQ